MPLPHGLKKLDALERNVVNPFSKGPFGVWVLAGLCFGISTLEVGASTQMNAHILGGVEMLLT